MEGDRLLSLARERFRERSWDEAYEHLVAAEAAIGLDPEDLERLATAAYLTGRDDESMEAWSRAHRGWLTDKRPDRAVRCAFWLGFGLIQRGEMAQGGGWLARAERLVEENRLDTVEQGYLLVPEGLTAMYSGELDVARAHFDRVKDLATRFGDRDLLALGTIGRGEALLRMGEGREGMRELDTAMVSVTADETTPVVAGLVYCAVIGACQEVFDLRRAHEWTAALDRWCDRQSGLVPYRGQCLVHRSQILQIRGAWEAAVGEAERARRWLGEPPHPALGMAHYQLGELHRLRGDWEAAEVAYGDAHAAGYEPEPGFALLRLAQGRREAAAAAIEMALEAARDHVSRAALLPAYVEIMLSADARDKARAAVDELTGLAGEGSVLLGALAAQAAGAVLLADEEPGAAAESLQDALHAWQALDAPYEAAQVRMLLAVACERFGDHDRAKLERGAARRVFERLGARPALARLDQNADRPPAVPITGREMEVLRLVAAGHTNRETARILVISEKTVERHLSNIFSKLDVSNRAAATAYAYQHDLV